MVAKVVNKMILNRIQPKIDPLLRKNQNGFRPGRSTVAHILALRRLIEGVKSNNRSAIITFVDFKKAFDSVNRQSMHEILKALWCSKVVTPDGETDSINILIGVLQGDTLAPYLFAIVLDFALRKAIDGNEENLGFHLLRRRSKRIAPTVLTDLDFADDIALVSQEIDSAQELLLKIELEAKRLGLTMNSKKTEIQSFNITRPLGIKSMSGEFINEVNNFKYLGAMTESSDKDFEVRKALAWTACNKLKKIWTSKMSRKLKERLSL